ncbi:MAG: hypothetical protein WCI73_03020 [Phycisphaerae bacterium]
MIRRRLIGLALVGTLPLLGVLAYQLPVIGQVSVAPVAPAGQPGAESFNTSLMRLEIKKAQIQATLATKIAQIRDAKLKYIKTQKEAGSVESTVLADAQIDADQAQAGAEIAALNLEIMQIQINDTIAHAASEPKPSAGPTDFAVLKIEAKKVQIQVNTAAKNLQTRQQDLQDVTHAAKADQAKIFDAQIDTEMASASLETSKLDQEALHIRLKAMSMPGR